MPRFASFVGIFLALLTGVFIAIFSSSTHPPRVSSDVRPTASSTLSVVSGKQSPITVVSGESSTTPTLEAVHTEEVSTTTPPIPKAKVVPPKIAVPVAKETIPDVTPPASSTPQNTVPLDTVASTLRSALVNIVCYVPVGSGMHSISGSGIIVDPKGIVLTNAHVAQYMLLADRGVSCSVRTGSPAIDKYEASLIYLSPAWVNANATVLTQTAPTGTGEYDFALFALTKSTTADALPSSFPFVSLARNPVRPGTSVVIASYGAQFLETSQIQSSLFPTIVFGSVKDIFTFATSTIDVLALGGSAAAQEGSSGGGVADSSGALVGTITTSTVSGSTDTRALDAITASYVRFEYERETQNSFDNLLNLPIIASVTGFKTQAAILERTITAFLK